MQTFAHRGWASLYKMEHTGWQDETADDEENDALGDVARAAEEALLALT